MSLGRISEHQLVHYIQAQVNWNDTNIANGNLIGYLPKTAILLGIYARVDTAFNAATTNNLLLGTTAGGNDLATTSDTAAGTAGYKSVTTGLTATATKNPTADVPVYVTYTQTGTAASAGQARVILEYIVDHSQL